MLDETIELAQAIHQRFIDLSLADSTNGNSELAIDILIGRDVKKWT